MYDTLCTLWPVWHTTIIYLSNTDQKWIKNTDQKPNLNTKNILSLSHADDTYGVTRIHCLIPVFKRSLWYFQGQNTIKCKEILNSEENLKKLSIKFLKLQQWTMTCSFLNYRLVKITFVITTTCVVLTTDWTKYLLKR